MLLKIEGPLDRPFPFPETGSAGTCNNNVVHDAARRIRIAAQTLVKTPSLILYCAFLSD